MRRDNYIPGRELERRYGVAIAPCPFCDSQDVGVNYRAMCVVCFRCEAEGPRVDRRTLRDSTDLLYCAITLWNARGRLAAVYYNPERKDRR